MSRQVGQKEDPGKTRTCKAFQSMIKRVLGTRRMEDHYSINVAEATETSRKS